MYEVLKALNKLSLLGIPYLSMCLSNILITSRGEIKLNHPLDYYIIGPDNSSHYYIAPEESQGAENCYLFKLDTWGLGIVVLECLSLLQAQNNIEK